MSSRQNASAQRARTLPNRRALRDLGNLSACSTPLTLPYLARRAVWIDDLISWTNPILEDCCRVKRRDSSQFCGPNDPEAACKPCFEDREPAWSTTREWLDSLLIGSMAPLIKLR